MSGAEMPVFSKPLWEWDKSVWTILQQICIKNPDQAGRMFHLESDAIDAISQLSPSQLERLASGIIASFVPEFCAQTLAEMIASSAGFEALMTHGPQTSSYDNLIERHYWELLARSALKNPDITSVQFGVSLEVVELIALASPSQINVIINQLSVEFQLRFSASVILEMIHASPQTALVKRAVESLTNHTLGGK